MNIPSVSSPPIKAGYIRPNSTHALRTLNKLRIPLAAGVSTVFAGIGTIIPKENFLVKAWLLATAGFGYFVSAICFVNNTKTDNILQSEITKGEHDYPIAQGT